ncbi:MAG: winged helix-turn-helix transcriptional regulator [Candidatus Aenigmarchaeota archaeon]|nr:winged helix-turn-helix transcriptional regulator [Candidatus Aenigmarchaeota archaeon]
MQKKIDTRHQFDNLFMHAKPVKMLVSLKSESVKYATQVSKTVDCTYSHTVKVLDAFNQLGLVEFEKKGRIKIVKLTDSGQDIAHDFEGIRRKFLRMARGVKTPEKTAVKKKSKKK